MSNEQKHLEQGEWGSGPQALKIAMAPGMLKYKLLKGRFPYF